MIFSSYSCCPRWQERARRLSFYANRATSVQRRSPFMTVTDRPDILWRPTAHDIEYANVTRFMRWLSDRRGVVHTTWNDLWEWSVHDLDEFWSAVWDYYAVTATRRPDHIVSGDAMPHTRWFSGAQLNYAENVL